MAARRDADERLLTRPQEVRPYEMFLSEVSPHFELVLGNERDLPDLCRMVMRRKRQVLYVRRSKTKTMDTRLKMIVGDFLDCQEGLANEKFVCVSVSLFVGVKRTLSARILSARRNHATRGISMRETRI